jgi:hypothetical protein
MAKPTCKSNGKQNKDKSVMKDKVNIVNIDGKTFLKKESGLI